MNRNALTKGQVIAAIAIIINAILNLLFLTLGFNNQYYELLTALIDISLSLYILFGKYNWVRVFKFRLGLGFLQAIIYYIDYKGLTNTLLMVLIYSSCLLLVVRNPGRAKRAISITILSLVYIFYTIGLVGVYAEESANKIAHSYNIPELSKEWELEPGNDKYSLRIYNSKYDAYISIIHESLDLTDGITHKDIVDVVIDNAKEASDVGILFLEEDKYLAFDRTLLKTENNIYDSTFIFYYSILTNSSNAIQVICTSFKDNYEYVEDDFKLVIDSFELK